MLDPANLDGHHIRFRLVTPEDASYIQGLRLSPEYGRHLSAAAPSIQAQREWIERYKAREAQGSEYYFVIERLDDGAPCGVVRLYEIEAEHFTWGSWILDTNKPFKAALDSALLIYRIAFNQLACKGAVFDVRLDNARTIAFHRRFGARQTHTDDLNIYFALNREEFFARAPALNEIFSAQFS